MRVYSINTFTTVVFPSSEVTLTKWNPFSNIVKFDRYLKCRYFAEDFLTPSIYYDVRLHVFCFQSPITVIRIWETDESHQPILKICRVADRYGICPIHKKIAWSANRRKPDFVAGTEEISNFLQGYFEAVKLNWYLKGEDA